MAPESFIQRRSTLLHGPADALARYHLRISSVLGNRGAERWKFHVQSTAGLPSMRRMQIAVGSTRRPKLEALRDAASQIAPLFGAGTTLEVVGCEVDSGVSHTPTSRDELMQGARQGAEALREKLQAEGARANFYVGLECGLDLVEANGVRRVFLES